MLAQKQVYNTMKSISINYNAHRVATEKDNYDPFAHEKREKKLKEDREKK